MAPSRDGVTGSGVTDPDRLARVGDWIIECATAADLLARVRGDNGPGG